MKEDEKAKAAKKKKEETKRKEKEEKKKDDKKKKEAEEARIARARHQSSSQSSSEHDSPIRNNSVREKRVGLGTARKAWGDFSAMHQELEEMSRQNSKILVLQVLQAQAASRLGTMEGPNVQDEIFRSQSDRSGLLETAVADTGCSYFIFLKALSQT